MLTNVQVADIIRAMGHGQLPSGCMFKILDKEWSEELVIAPDSPMPKVYYLKSDNDGNLVEFKCM